MKKRVTAFLVILAMALAISAFSLVQSAADDANENGEVTVTLSNDSAKEQERPVISAGAAVVMEAQSGRVLYALNPTAKRSIASTTKIMTAIVALENGNLNDKVEISSKAANTGGSTVGLREKEVYTLKELMYGMMLNSGNDAAVAIAEHIAGSVEKFAGLMNAKAKEIGASNSVFVTPHGLDKEGQYSTAYDLAIITRYALKNETFRTIVSTKSSPITGQTFHNTNELLDIYPGTDGVKTGYTGKAGRCLVSTAVKGDMRLISVVLGCASRTQRAEGSVKLLNYGFHNYKMVKLVDAGENVGFLPVVRGKSAEADVRATDRVELPLSGTELEQLEKKVVLEENLMAPVYAGVDCGHIVFSLNGTELASTAIKTWENIGRKNFFDYLGEIFIIWGDMMRSGI